MRRFLRFFVLGALLATAAGLRGTERIPPAPPRYFNDYAGIVRRATADQLNARLEQFERETSNQLLVAIYPRMESDSSVEDYTVRVAQAWKAGRKGRDNGAVLFAFMQEHQLYLQVGYGLEAVLPDAIAKRIIEDEIVPRFRAGDMDGGLRAAVNAMIAATRGEYKGTGRTVAERNRNGIGPFVPFLFTVVVFILIIRAALRGGQRVYGNPRHRSSPTIWWSGPGGWGGGGGSGGGGGGFSGGGGSFGGGGAGGKW